MSNPTKLRGGSDSELTKLKKLWRGLADDARAFWREQFSSDSKQAEVRKLLLARLQVNLRFDKQLNQFRNWVADQDERDLAAERMEDNAQDLHEKHPDWTTEQVRDAVIRAAYEESLARGDFKLGLSTVREDSNVKKLGLDREKLELLKRKAEQADTAKGILQDAELTEEAKKLRMYELFGIS